MTHFQTEIWDPEIPMIQPAAQIGDAPSDALVLFNGKDINLGVGRDCPRWWSETSYLDYQGWRQCSRFRVQVHYKLNVYLEIFSCM